MSKNKGGRPPKLSKDDLEDLREILKSKDYWTTKEVRVIIKEVFKKELSEDQVRRILREKLKMRLSKPYPHDYRRPEDAERVIIINVGDRIVVKDGYVNEYAMGDDRELQISLRKGSDVKVISGAR